MKEKLKQVIKNSDMSESDKEIWCLVIDKNEDFEAGIILEAIRENQGDLSFLTNMLKKKMEAAQAPGNRKWEEIIKEEEIYLNVE